MSRGLGDVYKRQELGKEEEKAVKQALAGRMGDEELSKEINDLMQKDKM